MISLRNLRSPVTHRKSAFRISFQNVLLLFYLVTLSIMLIAPTLNPSHNIDETLGGSSMWMTPLQAVVSAALGVFFIKPRHA